MRICRTKLLTLFEKTRTFTDFMIKKSHRAPNGIQSGTERNPIGRRTESDRTANATGKSFKLSKTANIGRKSARNRRFDRKWLFFVRNILLFLQIFSLLCSRNLTQYCSCATHILYVCAERWSVSLLNLKEYSR